MNTLLALSSSMPPRHAVETVATICTTPGSFGERARSRSARADSCFSLVKACNMRQDYWLYAVYNCATPNPRLARVQDPFGNLLGAYWSAMCRLWMRRRDDACHE